MIGQRLPDNAALSMQHPPGSYWKRDGAWLGITPNGHFVNLWRHAVTEHKDGTISVKQEIRALWPNGLPLWEGHLTEGIWRSCAIE